MRRPIVAKQSLDLQSNHFLRRSSGYPLGISLGELDYLRGWRDDFFGDSFHSQYSLLTYGGGFNPVLVDPFHGGKARCRSAAAAGSGSRLLLGGGYDTLDADEGWVCLARAKISHTTNIGAWIGAVKGNDTIQVAADTSHGGNWYIRNDNGTGAVAFADSGVAIDTDWHYFGLEVSTGRVDLFIDGAYHVSQTVKVPTAIIEPFFGVHAWANAIRDLEVDWIAWIPRNL